MCTALKHPVPICVLYWGLPVCFTCPHLFLISKFSTEKQTPLLK